MFGYACNETPKLMPAPIHYAHSILPSAGRSPPFRRARRCSAPTPRPRSRLQYEDGKPVARHLDRGLHPASDDRSTSDRCARSSVPHVRNVLPEGWMRRRHEFFHVNPTGRFVIGGPDGDCRPDRAQDHRRHLRRRRPAWRRRVLRQGPDQGRPLGRLCRALSRQERGRRRARRSLHHPAGLCHRRVPAAVRLCRPTAPAEVDEDKLAKVLQELMNLTPRGIREHLGLNKPIYARTSAYGHFGRAPETDGGFSWERTDLVNDLRSRLCLIAVLARRRRRAGRSAGNVYGRRRGRRLRVYKTDLLETLLPRLARSSRRTPARVCDPRALFDQPVRDVWLEIGFGSGEHLAAQAAAHPDIGMIGCEPFLNGVARAAGAHRAPAARAISASSPTTRARCSMRCPTPRSAAPSCCSPIPGPSRATTSGASSGRRTWRGFPAS